MPFSNPSSRSKALESRKETMHINKSLERTFRPDIVYLGVIAVLIFLYSWQPLQAGSDVFAHAAVGQWIFTHRSVPHKTLYLWSQTKDWVAHSWLSELIIYFLFAGSENRGEEISVAATVVISTAAFILLWRSRETAAIPKSLPVFFAIAVLAASLRFRPRPELFTDLFTVLVLMRFIGERRPMRLLSYLGWFALFVLWTNLHGAVLQGLVLILLDLIGSFLQFRTFESVKRTVILLGVCTMAVFVNPYGPHYFSIYTQTDSAIFRIILEWTPALKDPILPPYILFSLGILSVCALVLVVSDRKKYATELLWWAFGAASVLVARRNTLLCAVIDVALLCNHSGALSGLERKLKGKLTSKPFWSSVIARVIPYAVQAVFFVAIAVNSGFMSRTDPFNLIQPDVLPVQEVNFLLDNHITGKIFNDYNRSPYMEWRLRNQNTLFIDDINAYGDNIMIPWEQVIQAMPDGLRYLDQNGVNCFVGRNKLPGESGFPPIFGLLSSVPQWRLAYAGPDGPIWIRLPGKQNAITHQYQ